MIERLMPSIAISSSGMKAESTRLEVAAQNLANAETTRDIDGGIYQRRLVIFKAIGEDSEGLGKGIPGGVEVEAIVRDNKPPLRKYMPGHPDAGPDGYVDMPNISPLLELVDVMTATRAYEANLAAVKQARKIASNTIDLLRS
ncbi:MAG: flagellar basal body rod protein FlgC [Lentisphaerae bacterium]|nr:MAG: flagellar basal body rod protein FlgC [Lentisphaerota bacterium]